MSHGEIMLALAKKGMGPTKEMGKALKQDMKLDGKEAKLEASTKKDVLKATIKKLK